ncbi:hypothetical protein QCA50_006322 [Cerrena zonata]|uniref:Uncharacterized protein n=1 Tax=Cerrena zonata TaxID=2478898 RepID=A0AAW0FD25_9APHY
MASDGLGDYLKILVGAYDIFHWEYEPLNAHYEPLNAHYEPLNAPYEPLNAHREPLNAGTQCKSQLSIDWVYNKMDDAS